MRYLPNGSKEQTEVSDSDKFVCGKLMCVTHIRTLNPTEVATSNPVVPRMNKACRRGPHVHQNPVCDRPVLATTKVGIDLNVQNGVTGFVRSYLGDKC